MNVALQLSDPKLLRFCHFSHFCHFLVTFALWGSFLAANGDFTNSGDIYHFDTTSYSEEQTNSLFEINNEISKNGNKIYFNKNISKVLIYDISGKLIKHKNNFNNNFIDLSELNSAFYIVKAVDINENYTTKKIYLNQ